MRAFVFPPDRLKKRIRECWPLWLALVLWALCGPVGRAQAGPEQTGLAQQGIASSAAHKGPESELIFEGLGSFGHFHVFAYSWWSYLDVGGIEYDRHSWDRFL